MSEATPYAADGLHVSVVGIGDVVTLRAGGPRMTVIHAGAVRSTPGHWLVCQWFDDHGELRQDAFSQDMVQREPRSISAGRVQMRARMGVQAGMPAGMRTGILASAQAGVQISARVSAQASI